MDRFQLLLFGGIYCSIVGGSEGVTELVSHLFALCWQGHQHGGQKGCQGELPLVAQSVEFQQSQLDRGVQGCSGWALTARACNIPELNALVICTMPFCRSCPGGLVCSSSSPVFVALCCCHCAFSWPSEDVSAEHTCCICSLG